MRVGEMAGIAISTKVMNNKLKPNFGPGRYIAFSMFVLLALGFLAISVMGFMKGDIGQALTGIVATALVIYAICITPLMVKDVKVTITENNEIHVFHKKKEVIVDLVKDEEDKYDFANPLNKISCIRYADGSKMPAFYKYRVCNKLVEVLGQSQLLSKNVRLTLE